MAINTKSPTCGPLARHAKDSTSSRGKQHQEDRELVYWGTGAGTVWAAGASVVVEVGTALGLPSPTWLSVAGMSEDFFAHAGGLVH